jgi:hypothetical protein
MEVAIYCADTECKEARLYFGHLSWMGEKTINIRFWRGNLFRRVHFSYQEERGKMTLIWTLQRDSFWDWNVNGTGSASCLLAGYYSSGADLLLNGINCCEMRGARRKKLSWHILVRNESSDESGKNIFSAAFIIFEQIQWNVDFVNLFRNTLFSLVQIKKKEVMLSL